MTTPALDMAARRPVDLLWSRFVGDIGKTDRYLYDQKPTPGWSSEPLTERVLEEHVLGRRRVGVGQIGSTLYGVIDFDGKVKQEDGSYVLDPAKVEEAWQNTKRVVSLFERHGFKVLVEISRSVGGWHVWILCDPVDPPSVDEMRGLLKAALRALGLPDDGNEGAGHAGLFPHPPGDKGCGRTSFLPWSGLLNGGGGALFVDPADGVPLERQETALEDAQLVTRAEVVKAIADLDAAEKELRQAKIITAVSSSLTLTRPTDAARHDVLRSYTMRWANAGLGELEVRTFAYRLAEEWGLIAEGRGNEVENLIRGAMLKARPPTQADEPRIREASYIDLFDLMTKPQEEIPWQLRGYMSEGEWVTISAEWGGGKSLTAMDLAIALATGTPWMGHVPVIGGPYSVLYVDEENGRKLAERRLRQLLFGRKLTAEQARLVPLKYAARSGVRLDDPTWRDWLRREIERQEARQLFLDSLIRFARIKENSNDENAAFFGDVIQPLMNEYDLSIVALDHMGKPSKERTDLGHRGRGASEKPGANDELICMDGERGQDTRTITHEKTRWHQYQPALVTTCTESADETECWLEAKEEKPEVVDVVARHLMSSGLRGVLREDIIEFVAATLKGKGTDKSVSRALKTLKDQHAIKAKTEGKKVRYWSAVYAPGDAK